MRRPRSVLSLDDDEAVLAIVDLFLRGKGLVVMAMNTPIGITERIRTFKPDVIVLDQEMPAINGDRVAKLVRANCGPSVPLVLYSGSDRWALAKMAGETKNTFFVSKAEGLEALHEAIYLALHVGLNLRDSLISPAGPSREASPAERGNKLVEGSFFPRPKTSRGGDSR
jgi:CheY-like chemotaxis protein